MQMFRALNTFQKLISLALLVGVICRQTVEIFNCGKLYYRAFYVDSERDELFVGAMSKLFGLNLVNMNSSNFESDAKIFNPVNTIKCSDNQKSKDYNYQNHIRAIQPWPSRNGTKLHICGTNACNPNDYVIDLDFGIPTENNFLQKINGLDSSKWKCPISPDSNSTTIWVADGTIHKLIPFQNNDKSKNLTMIDTFNGTYPEQVRAMALSSKHKSLYISSDKFIYHIHIAASKESGTFSRCVEDPYCQWDINRKKCKPYK